MSGDEKFWLWVWGIIGVGVCAASLCIGWAVRENARVYLEHGCATGMLPGAGTSEWICP